VTEASELNTLGAGDGDIGPNRPKNHENFSAGECRATIYGSFIVIVIAEE
jgi:hypothetical protein